MKVADLPRDDKAPKYVAFPSMPKNIPHGQHHLFWELEVSQGIP